jgi:hypothetical protein
MWVNPKYRDEQPAPAPAAPPEPSGLLLAAFARKSPEGLQQELRIVLDTYQNRPYLAVRLWQRDRRTGSWWPMKGKGVSIRLSEVEGAVEALRKGGRIAGQGGDRATRRAAGQGPRQARAGGGRDDRPRAFQRGFDEFGG